MRNSTLKITRAWEVVRNFFPHYKRLFGYSDIFHKCKLCLGVPVARVKAKALTCFDIKASDNRL